VCAIFSAMRDDDPADASNWRDRSERRRTRARKRRLAAVVIVVAVVAAVIAVLEITRPEPAAELTEAAKDFTRDWPSMSVDDLCSTWFRPDMDPSRRRKLEHIFERRDWLERRPEIRYVLDEMRPDKKKGRSEYEIEGFPQDRRMKVYWDRLGRRWYVTAPSIPILEDD